MAVYIYFIFYLTIWIYSCYAYKALVVTQMPSRSHSILNNGLVRQLLKDGNEVTYVRTIEYENAPPTLRQIDISLKGKVRSPELINLAGIMNKAIQANDHTFVRHAITAMGIRTVENEGLQRILRNPKENFDVVIVEFMDNDILASLSAVFQCPLIWLSPIEVNSNILSRIDKEANPAYVPDWLSKYIAPFTFVQRLKELWIRMNSQFMNYWYFDKIEAEAYDRLIVPHILRRGRQPPSLKDIRYNASLVLGYSHVSIGDAVSLPQSYKPVGGYHIEEDLDPLPENIKHIMENAKHGVIFFSMGSSLNSTEFPDTTKQELLDMFESLNQTVLWKLEEQLPDTPKNVHILPWFPQTSIISHPKCKLFITHGGLLSTTEALYFGMPIIGLPVFGDQFVNINRAVKKGFAIKVDVTYNMVDELKAAIEIMLTDSSYREKAKELSFVYHDRPVKPAEELTHWVRHVVQTRGAPHLRSPTLQVPLYQLLYIDLLVIFILTMIFTVKIMQLSFTLGKDKIRVIIESYYYIKKKYLKKND